MTIVTINIHLITAAYLIILSLHSGFFVSLPRYR